MQSNLGGCLAIITMKELLEAGVHFGHQTKRWNPKMKEYIFGERNGIYIIDLQKTLKMFKEASKFVQEVATEGKTVLFVGTKRQAQDAIAEEAKRCGMFYVNNRWLGGLLTNWVTVQKSVKRLKELDEMATDGRYELLPKKEVIKLGRERKRSSRSAEPGWSICSHFCRSGRGRRTRHGRSAGWQDSQSARRRGCSGRCSRRSGRSQSHELVRWPLKESNKIMRPARST